MKTKYLLFVLSSLFLLSACCSKQCPQGELTITSEKIDIDASKDAIADQAYMEYLAPTKAFMDAEMGIVLGYAPERMYVDTFECPMLNWAADALLEAAQSVCPQHVDIALLNRGGTRCNWAAGDITLGHVFKMMPFDNKMVVVTLKGQDIIDLFTVLAKGDAQGIAGMKVKFVNKELAALTIAGKPVDPQATYRVATNSYLAKGKDGMEALARDPKPWDSGLLIRDIYIEAVRKQGTVRAAVDGRMMIEK
jgi:2',3'-cyclic-nucleotide 2'-phosphodiesterase (5'-nucleotidase family)